MKREYTIKKREDRNKFYELISAEFLTCISDPHTRNRDRVNGIEFCSRYARQNVSATEEFTYVLHVYDSTVLVNHPNTKGASLVEAFSRDAQELEKARETLEARTTVEVLDKKIILKLKEVKNER